MIDSIENVQGRWEAALAELLSELSAVQHELLELLSEKRNLLIKTDLEGLASTGSREQQLVAKLEACHHHRSRLLELAAAEGLPCNNLHTLAAALPSEDRRDLQHQIAEAQARSRLLHHQSLTNWVLVQRNLIHLSQMLEFIATGGRAQPTYTRNGAQQASGALVDQAV
jgi:hypothetical protein